MATKHLQTNAPSHRPLSTRKTTAPNAQSRRADLYVGHRYFTEGLDLNWLARWISRRLNVALAELKLVDFRSLDVLLVCADELTCATVSGDAEREHAGIARREHVEDKASEGRGRTEARTARSRPD